MMVEVVEVHSRRDIAVFKGGSAPPPGRHYTLLPASYYHELYRPSSERASHYGCNPSRQDTADTTPTTHSSGM